MQYILQYLTLTQPALLHIVQTPVTDCLLILAEHPFARTGNIGNEYIKLFVESSEVRWTVLCDHRADGIGSFGHTSSPLGHILGQYEGSFGHHLIAHKHRPLGQKTSQKGGFATRSGTEVKSGKGQLPFCSCRRKIAAKQIGNVHRRGFLHIIGSCMQQRITGESGPPGKIPGIRAPGDSRVEPVKVLAGCFHFTGRHARLHLAHIEAD